MMRVAAIAAKSAAFCVRRRWGITVPAVDHDAGGEHEGHEGEREHRDELAAL